MPVRDQINNSVGSDLYSAEVYDRAFFKQFDPAREFEKWATVEVTDFSTVPDGMKPIVFPYGLYAVFLHRGPVSAALTTYRYIYQTWIPNSEYSLVDRPHFAIMGEKYQPESGDFEEEIWIPVKKTE
jgi:AraC family transcriptional regulator